MTTRDVGKRGEDTAVSFVEDKGWTVLDRNWHCRHGELDVVGKTDDGVVVFLEVKFRSSTKFGGGLAAVTPSKLKKIKLASVLWMHEHREILRECHSQLPFVRFDVIDVGPRGVREHVEGVI